MLFTQHQRNSDCRDGLSEPDNVTEHRPTACHNAASEGPHGGGLVVEQLRLHLERHRILTLALAHIAREVVAKLEEDLVGWLRINGSP